MLKTIAAAGLVLAVTGMAAEAKVIFKGGFTITGLSGDCGGTNVGWTMFGRLSPAGLTGNDTLSSRFAIFQTDGAFSYDVDGSFDSTFKPARWTTLYDAGYVETDTPNIRFVEQNPAVLTDTTDFLTVVGDIQNFDFNPTCTATFHFAGARQYE